MQPIISIMGDIPSVRKIFIAFMKIGSIAFGGMYSMLAFFERDIVRKKGWLSHEDFTESIVIGQITPGAPIVNTGIFIGYKLKKIKGVLVTVAGLVIPSFLIILVIAHYYTQYHDLKIIQSALKGVGAAVVGLIASVVFGMGKTTLKNYRNIIFSALAFIGLSVFKWNPIAIIIIAGVAGLIIFRGERI